MVESVEIDIVNVWLCPVPEFDDWYKAAPCTGVPRLVKGRALYPNSMCGTGNTKNLLNSQKTPSLHEGVLKKL